MTRTTVIAALVALAMGVAGCHSMSPRDDGPRGASGTTGSGSVLNGSHPQGATDDAAIGNNRAYTR